MLAAFGVTDKGRVRPINEDCFAIEEALGLCVVADGMGGHNAGEVAARLAVDTVVEVVKQWRADSSHPFGLDQTLSTEGNVLRTSILVANAQILERATTA